MSSQPSPFDDEAVRVLAWVRTGLGVVAFLAPWVPARPWIGDDARRSSATTLARALGGRDMALGLGTLVAGRHGGPAVRVWLAGSALADTGDAIATLVDWRSRPPLGRVAVLAAASAGAVACAVLARRTPA